MACIDSIKGLMNLFVVPPNEFEREAYAWIYMRTARSPLTRPFAFKAPSH